VTARRPSSRVADPRACAAAGQGCDGTVRLETVLTGNAFITEPGAFVDVLAKAVETVVGQAPILSTTGGISDARFIRKLCPVVELGLVGATMHAVDERSPIAEIEGLTAIYEQVIEGYFKAFA
jgi:succinyl-diaminopimelate desuccinylase